MVESGSKLVNGLAREDAENERNWRGITDDMKGDFVGGHGSRMGKLEAVLGSNTARVDLDLPSNNLIVDAVDVLSGPINLGNAGI